MSTMSCSFPTNTLPQDLHKTILQFYEDYCQERYNVEMESGVFNNLVREVTEDGTPTKYIARRL